MEGIGMKFKKREFIDGDLISAEHYGKSFHVNYCKEDECCKDGMKKVEEVDERFDPRLYNWTIEGYTEWTRSLKFR